MQDEFVSKTRKKQEMTELQKVGVELTQLSEVQIKNLLLEENLKNAILEAKRIKSHEAKRRQMQYVGRLMREVDPAPIRAQLEAITGQSAQATAAHKRLEAWRAKLLADDAALTDFALKFPGSDIQALRTLIRNVRKEQNENKPPRAYRELFRLIKECSASNPS